MNRFFSKHPNESATRSFFKFVFYPTCLLFILSFELLSKILVF